ncbi:DUF979 domain-containing protein [Pseudomonas helleri]|jgi:uncharacterized membrane protein|uniref:DUF979 family protein n=1 Tax=Pseudomonas helleri TaxID=1608996 RepID=A0A6A7ZEA6_9PSED|nr:DUF979 domain-containing protein [Pseudomonas helleri]KMN22656.1 permease [Pseudomonas helleri]MQT38796.1 DUF979 family protein [Pseudomonas helleri]MQT77505.1 DUF979 family protein [Pseudomonas helleri]MQT98056.1 DUF979 family protein [Pseudomonas helleri]MQU08360.1 DUF979 family protein [Pseudomonas helleri]
MIISIEYFYWLAGVLLLITAGMILCDRTHPKRWTSGLFWMLFALVFLIGDRLSPFVIGIGVLVMAVIAGIGGVGRGAHAELHVKAARASAGRLGHRLFIPALSIPLVTVIGSVLLKHTEIGGVPLLDPKNTTFVSLGMGCIVALILACMLTRDTPLQALRESRRLTEALGWTMVLPQMLAMLGLLFNDAGVGTAVAHVTTAYINMDFRLVAVVVYVLGMALFTVIMGNGFAAFPVMTGGVGVPVLVGMYGANPALMAAIGMFSGYCGTLMTPMAANYNIVPVALLELPDKYAVIKAQIPTAVMMLLVNIVLLYTLM